MEAGTGSYFAAKINANFPTNPRERGLPTIQGVVALFDAVTGRPLALLDSIAVTTLRTAAATAVAAKYLARRPGFGQSRVFSLQRTELGPRPSCQLGAVG
jgi:ornithine cyclodeaminase/alanine dehydrogenase-like protein (mu-crystallin family)